MPNDTPEMTVEDVLEILELFAQNHIALHIDGGWAVDALLGEQTRPHTDLDIAVQHKDVDQIRALLEERGFRDVPRDDTRACNFVLGDERGRQIDIHSYTFDSDGKNIYGVAYPFDSLSGAATIGGYRVQCVSPEWLVKFHTGYALDENDYHDVRNLCRRYGIDMPSEYDEFERKAAKDS